MEPLVGLTGLQGKALAAALSSLTPRRRQAVELRWGEGMTLAKVAAAMGISSPAAYQLSTLGLARLIRKNPALAGGPSMPAAHGDRRDKQQTGAMTMASLKRAREIFMEKERRDIYYRVALTLIEAARRRGSWVQVDVAEGTGILLQNWNMTRYRYRKGGFGNADVHRASAGRCCLRRFPASS